MKKTLILALTACLLFSAPAAFAAEAGSGARSGAGSGAGDEAGAGAETGTGSGARSGAGAEAGAGAVVGAGAGAEAEAEAGAETKAEAEAKGNSLAISTEPPRVLVHGLEVDAPPPFYKDGILWVPFRAIAEAYNFRVEWDADAWTVKYINGYSGSTFTFDIDGINAIIVDGRTFVPYGFFDGLDVDGMNIAAKLGYPKSLEPWFLECREVFRKEFAQPNGTLTLRNVTRGLPWPAGYRYNGDTLSAEPTKSISIEYQYDEGDKYKYEGGNGLFPFYDSVLENNALLLFAIFEDLEQVDFILHTSENNSDPEQDRAITYTLGGLTERFGAINPIDMGFAELYGALASNIQPSEWYFAHHSRIYLGADTAEVSYRNGEPGETVRRPDGSVVWVYNELGRAWVLLPTGETRVVDPGCTAKYYFNNPLSEQDAGRSGLYAAMFSVADGDTCFKLATYLGWPAIVKDMGGGCVFVAYPLRDGQNKHSYFILRNGRIAAEGIMYGDDYAALDFI